MRKFRPKARSAGSDPSMREIMTPPRMTSTAIAATRVRTRKRTSAIRSRLSALHLDATAEACTAQETVGDPQPVERLCPRRHRVSLNRVGSQRNIDHGSPPGGLHPGAPCDCRGERRSKATSWPHTSRMGRKQRKGPGTAPFQLYLTSVGHGVERLA